MAAALRAQRVAHAMVQDEAAAASESREFEAVEATKEEAQLTLEGERWASPGRARARRRTRRVRGERSSAGVLQEVPPLFGPRPCEFGHCAPKRHDHTNTSEDTLRTYHRSAQGYSSIVRATPIFLKCPSHSQNID